MRNRNQAPVHLKTTAQRMINPDTRTALTINVFLAFIGKGVINKYNESGKPSGKPYCTSTVSRKEREGGAKGAKTNEVLRPLRLYFAALA